MIGSLVQGLGGAVLEHLIYDEHGQFLTGSLADYLLPTASDFPNLRCVVLDDYPSPINPLGAKGAGEGGIIAAGGVHGECGRQRAEQSFGVQPRELPLSPTCIWELVQAGAAARRAARHPECSRLAGSKGDGELLASFEVASGERLRMTVRRSTPLR